MRRCTPSAMDGAALSAWLARTSVVRTILVALAVALAASWPVADSTRPMLTHDEGSDALIAVRSRRQAAPSRARSAASARASCRSNSLAASPSGAAAQPGASHPLRCFERIDPTIAPGGLAQSPSASPCPHSLRVPISSCPQSSAASSPGHPKPRRRSRPVMCYLLEPSARWMSIPEPTAGLSPLCSSCVVLSTTRALSASTDAMPPKPTALPSIIKYNSMIVGGIVQLFVLSASGFSSSLSARYARLRPAEQPSGFASPARERLQGVH